MAVDNALAGNPESGAAVTDDSVTDPAKAGAAAEAAPGAGEGQAKDTAAPEWKDYVDDPAKSAEENAAAKAEHDKTKPAPTGAPEAYADFTLPEGVTIAADDLKSIHEFSKKNNFTQEQAQEAVDKIADLRKRDYEAQVKVWEDTQNKWVSDAKADKEYGGDKFDANLAVAKKAIAQFGSPELNAALVATGAGNHPEIIRAFYRVGLAISEDKTLATGGRPAGGKADAASILYPEPSK